MKHSAADATPNRPATGSPSPEAELDRQARAETDAGTGVPIDEVETWVRSWDTPQELPMPKARRLR